jgi:hypothetical protein
LLHSVEEHRKVGTADLDVRSALARARRAERGSPHVPGPSTPLPILP